MKVILGHLDWGLGTKSSHSDPADKTFLGLCIVSTVSKWSNRLLKMSKNFCRWLLLKTSDADDISPFIIVTDVSENAKKLNKDF